MHHDCIKRGSRIRNGDGSPSWHGIKSHDARSEGLWRSASGNSKWTGFSRLEQVAQSERKAGIDALPYERAAPESGAESSPETKNTCAEAQLKGLTGDLVFESRDRQEAGVFPKTSKHPPRCPPLWVYSGMSGLMFPHRIASDRRLKRAPAIRKGSKRR
jgi:hypothetical protein